MSSVPGECRLVMGFGRLTTFTSFGTYGSMTVFGDSGSASYYPNPSSAVTLWVTDGTAQNTLGIPGFPGLPNGIAGENGAGVSVMVNGTLFLDSSVGGAGHEPWRLNLTTGQVGMLRDISPGSGSSNPNSFFPLDGGRGAGFMAYDTSSHVSLFVSDGTPVGTRRVSQQIGAAIFNTKRSIGSRVFFVSSSPSGGAEPYAIDLCPADYDNSGAATVDDLFAYLQDWFAGSRDADMDNSGGSPDVSDLMGFFNTWMSGCPS